VTAVEKDDILWARLSEAYAQEPNLSLVRGDVLHKGLIAGIIRDMVAQARPEGGSDGPSGDASASGSQATARVKVVANLPYNITKDFLLTMLPMGDIVSELSIMIQEEAAVRLCDATPSRPDYRSMNIRVNFYSVPKYRWVRQTHAQHTIRFAMGLLLYLPSLLPWLP
jgi:16S rRNA (adenine1518-N6/adenine1519-N6)-dimethyltransferase